MKKIKILISSRPKLLSEVILDLIEHQLDMTVVGEVIDPIELLIAVRATKVDSVIITPLKANGEPRICHKLLEEHPQLKIVTISAKGDAAFLFQADGPRQRIDDPSGLSILHAIRTALP
ncbi:MAG: DNA-binding response regulator [Calditrichaeota bacterium]|nr:MAG: DNA-binding response regulator [Calditrichota bacterium]